MIRVGIVEDNLSIRTSLELLIGGSPGFAVCGSSATAEEALHTLQNWNADVVLMDINLGRGMDGIACISNLREMGVGCQFMMCTVYEDDSRIFDALKAGATGYILKKSSPMEILEAIKELHGGGSPMSTEIARRVVSFFMNPEARPQQPAAANNQEELNKLTAREKEILDSLADGLLYKEIADRHQISMDTVRRHVHNIYGKLQVGNRTEAINRAFKR